MQISQNKQTLNYVVQNLKYNKKLFTILSVFMAVGLLLSTFCFSILTKITDTSHEIFSELTVVGLVVFVVAIFVYILLASERMFSYNLLRSKTDMAYSIPIKRRNQFMGDFFGGLISVLVPYIVFSFVAIIIAIIAFKNASENSYLELPSNFVYILWSTYLLGIIAIISAYSTIIMVCQFTGTVTDTLLFSVFTIGSIPAIIMIITSFIHDNIVGETVNTSSLVYGTNPFGIAIYILMRINNMGGNYDTFDFPLWFFIVLSLINIIITFAISFIMNQKRKSEDTGNSIIFKIVYYIIIALSSAICVSFGKYSNSIPVMIVTEIILVAVLYIIVNRGKWNLKLALINLAEVAVMTLVVLGFMSAIESTNAFGYGQKLPKTSNLTDVTVDYYMNNSTYSITYSDEDDIQKILDFNQAGIDDGYSIDCYDYEDMIVDVNISYNKKSGFKSYKNCAFSLNQSGSNFFDYICSTDEYREQMSVNLKNAVSSNEYEDTYSGYENYILVGDGNIYSDRNYNFSKEETENLAEELYNASVEDYKDFDFCSTQHKVYLTINDVYIYEDNKNIISVLDEYGINDKDFEKTFAEIEDITIIDPNDYFMSGGTFFYDEDPGSDAKCYGDNYEVHTYDSKTFNQLKEQHTAVYGNLKSFDTGFSYIIANNEEGIKDNLVKLNFSEQLYKFYCERVFYQKTVINDENDEYYIMLLNGKTIFIPKNAETEAMYNSFK